MFVRCLLLLLLLCVSLTLHQLYLRFPVVFSSIPAPSKPRFPVRFQSTRLCDKKTSRPDQIKWRELEEKQQHVCDAV